MRRFFFRRRPAPSPAPLICRADADIINRVGITLTEWLTMTDPQRADIRWRAGL